MKQFEVYRARNTSRSTTRYAQTIERAIPGGFAAYGELDGKIALVTGVTKGGIGFEVAKQLAQLGAKVYCAGRTESKVRASMAAITGSTEFLKLDLSISNAVLSSPRVLPCPRLEA